MPFEAGQHVVGEAGGAERDRRDVDVHAQRRRARPERAPGRHLRHGGVEHPAVERDDQAGLLGHRDERVRRAQPVGRVPPAQQRLHGGGPPGRQLDDRLVVGGELVARQRGAQLVGLAEPAQRRDVHRGLVDRRAAPAVRLGHVHRGVGVPQEDTGGLAPLGEAHTDAGADPARLAARAHGHLQRGHDPVGDVEDLPFGGVHDDQGELVATEPGDGVGAAADRPQPAGDLHQQLIADGVAEAVVDGLEPVEVEHEHRGHVTAELGVGHGLVDALGQEGAVGEVGQRVVEGEALQLAVGVGELAGALGHPPFEVLVERFQLLSQHVDADDHGVDVVRGGRGRQANGEFAGCELHDQLDELFQARIRLRRRHRHTPRGNDHFPQDGSSRKSVDGATRRDRLVGGASRSRVTRPCLALAG